MVGQIFGGGRFGILIQKRDKLPESLHPLVLGRAHSGSDDKARFFRGGWFRMGNVAQHRQRQQQKHNKPEVQTKAVVLFHLAWQWKTIFYPGMIPLLQLDRNQE